MNQACLYLGKARDTMKKLRANFLDFLEDAKQVASSWNISHEMKHMRQRIMKRFYNEIVLITELKIL